MRVENQECTRLLALMKAPKGTAVSYAIQVKGEIVVKDALGVIDQRQNLPLTPDCTFNVASISKIYCTVAVLQLQEQGKLSLNDTVADWLPEFWMPDERYQQITIRMCLDHTSGLPGTQWKHFHLTEVGKVDFYQETLAYLAKSHLKADPGAYSVYCNDGFTLAEMVVAKASGMRYEEYIQKWITDPIQASSTRLASTLNPDHPLVSEGKKPKERLMVQGAAGITTTMSDLCRFGQLFLEKNAVLSETAKACMNQKWGVSFLPEDKASLEYGLGWDTVCFQDPDYDLGDHVLVKGGNSMTFTSKLIVIPKYEAVLAISQTHDCKIDVQAAILRLFATWMLQQGKNISRFSISKSTPADGLYLQPTGALRAEQHGFTLILSKENQEGDWELQELLSAEQDRWVNEKGEAWFFTEQQSRWYMMKEVRGKTMPIAMKACPVQPLSPVWEKRLGRRYIAVNISPYDLTVGDLLAAFTLKAVDGAEGLMKISVHHRKANGFISGLMEMPFAPIDDQVGHACLDTPYNGSRDAIDPFFEIVDGKEYVEVASYRYLSEEDVEEYQHQGFLDQTENQVYKVTEKLSVLPEIPLNRRIICLDEKLELIYDSLDDQPFEGFNRGILILI